MPTLVNEGLVTADFGTYQLFDESSAVLSIPSIRLLKTVTPEIWQGDEVTYTARVDNLEEIGGAAAEDVEFTDTIALAFATLVPGSVAIDSVPATTSQYSYNDSTGLLTVQLPNMNPQTHHIITFRIKKNIP